ncbi:MAG: hypothetical protein NTV43_07020 [Methylococcales bacterium]|nr:hypothetical protein [Methylococcales bacterium]
MTDNIPPQSLPKDVEKYGDALVKAWEQYLKIIDIYIALSGATGLIMGNLIKEIGFPALKNAPQGVTAIIAFGFCLLSLGLWRYAAQYFYEYETIGGSEIADKYFKYYGIEKPITRAFLPNPKKMAYYRLIYRWARYGSGIFYCVTWASFLLLVFCT